MLLDRYMTYLLKTSQKLAPTSYCTAVVPYQELPCVRAGKEAAARCAEEGMEVEAEQTGVGSLKRKRGEEEQRFVPKMMKVQCCL